MELTHPMTLTDPTVLPRAIRLVEYLEAVRNLREQPIRDVAEYRDGRWWAGDIPAHPACGLPYALARRRQRYWPDGTHRSCSHERERCPASVAVLEPGPRVCLPGWRVQR